jgi:hypothetical protein
MPASAIGCFARVRITGEIGYSLFGDVIAQ